jgi:uncharacterized repeat protein (TIGR02543 family)
VASIFADEKAGSKDEARKLSLPLELINHTFNFGGCMKHATRIALFTLMACLGAAQALAQTVQTVGATGADYSTLKAAFDAVNAGAITGAIQLQVLDNTTETASAVLNASGTGSASYTSVSITPTGGAARTIGGSLVGLPLVDFNGADNVTIDGLNTGGNSLTIVNQSTSSTAGTSTIRFRADATSNTITNCTINGAATASVSTSANGGNIWFSTGTITGNDNNVISDCNIGPDGANLPSRLLWSSGATGSTLLFNSSITVTRCNLYDFFNASGQCRAIDVWSGNTDWTISDNRFYQTAPRIWTTGAEMRVISITSGSVIISTLGNNFQISGNVIGFADANGTGTFSISGGANSFKAMFLSVGPTVASNIQGNTITAISNTTTLGGTADEFSPSLICVSLGLVNVGTTAANTFGSLSSAGSIFFSSSSASNNTYQALFSRSVYDVAVSNNTIGGITTTNTGGGSVFLYVINMTTAASATISNNTIGSVAGPILNNATNVQSRIVGINLLTRSSSYHSTVTNNRISNATLSAGNISNASMVGIAVQPEIGASTTVSQNTIFSLSNTNTTAAVKAAGISFVGAATTAANTISRNLIHSLKAYQIDGIALSHGIVNVSNNMIRLGIDAAGNSLSNGSPMNGIIEEAGSASSLFSYYNNSVYIGGTGVAGTVNTHALRAPSIWSRNIVNNIFVNARSNGAGTGKHYAVNLGVTSVTTGVTYNNNLYQTTGTGGVFGFFNNADVANLTAWRTATGQESYSMTGDPAFVNPTGSSGTVDLHINSNANPIPVGYDAGTPIASVTTDFDGSARSATTPDIGAHEYLIVRSLTASAGPNGSITPEGVTIVNYGSSQGYSVVPHAGYAVQDVLVDGVSVGAVSSYMFSNVTVDHTIAATFMQSTFTIGSSAGANGSISPTPTAVVNAGGNQTFVITPDAGYHVADVLVDDASVGAVTSYEFTNVSANHTIAASFSILSYPLTITVVGSGSAAKAPDQAIYGHGTVVSLTATPLVGWNFAGWSGDATSSLNPLNVTMDAAKNITATFTIDAYTLTINAANGIVAKNPDQPTYTHGSVVQLTPSPSAGYSFTGWSGDASGTANPLAVSMDANKSITANFVLNAFATITGSVQVNSVGLANVVVKLLDSDGNFMLSFPAITTSSTGTYSFADVPSGFDYQVMIVEPLGYSVDENPKLLTLNPSGAIVNFALTLEVVANRARGVAYWKHQFDEHRCRRRRCEETEAQLLSYIAAVHEHYDPHFSIFQNLTTIEQWGDMFTVGGRSTMRDRAKKQLAALLMNLVSLKVGQYTIATRDNRTAGDVLTYVSILITDNTPANDQLARNLAMKVNNRDLIAVGAVPASNILYKGRENRITWGFGIPIAFGLSQNYPNPFNPTTEIRYQMPEVGHVTLTVYNVLGGEVATLVDREKPAGTHSVSWDASGMASGVYLYRLHTGRFSETRKMLLLR